MGKEKTPNRELRAADTGAESGFKVGQAAPKDKYVDLDGKVSDKPVEAGALLVAEGDIVTPAIADALK